ncbi:unnamed protein product [Menidia menidia]|uniref:(Atlantic silverside) hypothetical protein n=1 Tax=Menidia menidia TaxID=238744 RepID=A0A8S4BQ97_9TELE|nr:unnamed protein product [Menidia menidia]
MPEASLKQLIDALRKDGVLNNLQKEEILQKNPVRADKARDLLDYVKNQGENACKKMIEHFKAIDPALSSDLDFSPAHPLLKEFYLDCELKHKSAMEKKFKTKMMTRKQRDTLQKLQQKAPQPIQQLQDIHPLQQVKLQWPAHQVNHST